MRIAAIFPPYRHKVFAENLSAVDTYFGRFQPLNLLYAAAFMKRAGQDLLVLDAHTTGMTPEQCISAIRAFDAQLLAFNLSTYMFHDTMKWIRLLREATGLPVLTGGINLRLYPRETMQYPEIDYAIIGEAGPVVKPFFEALESGAAPEGIPGAAYRSDGGPVINMPENFDFDFDDYPLPARELVDNSLYFSHVSQRRNFSIGLSATGCPFNCNYCAVPGKKYSVRSTENVLAEVDECYSRYSIREIDYFDATFTVNRRRTVEICEGLIRRGYDFEWSCRSRLDTVDDDLLGLMARSGCKRIYFGIETNDEEILKRIHKGLHNVDTLSVLSRCRAVGIRPLGFFMIGNPGETRETALKTIRFAKSLPLDYAQFSRTIAKPDSPLAAGMANETGVDFWGDFVAGKTPEKRMDSPWTELSQTDIEQLTWRAYIEFYFRPLFALRALAKAKSFDEIKRYARVAWNMIFQKRECDD
ncbi:MAG TPA: radical SAM protein [bacterium]|nr:radical SAM protein [bacterium]